MVSSPTLALQTLTPVARFILGSGGSHGGGAITFLLLFTICGPTLLVHPNLGAWCCVVLGLAPFVVSGRNIFDRELLQILAMVVSAAMQTSIGLLVLRQRSAVGPKLAHRV